MSRHGMMEVVVRVHLEYLGDSVELPPGETLVGRDLSCALRFNDPAVSRRHLRFIRRRNEVFVEDLGSSNGTLVNGQVVNGPERLIDGDRVSVGERTVLMRITEADDDQPDTLLLSSLDRDMLPLNAKKTPSRGATTLEMPVVQHRCPHCAAKATPDADECASCGYQWGGFRPQSRTDVEDNPLMQRRHHRQQIELALVYSSRELEVEAMSHDLSESGVFVCTEVLDPVGTECQLTILIDGGPPLVLSGVVRRVVSHSVPGGSTGLGIEFVRLASSASQWIRSALARLERTVA
jgi:hypothetical protein